MNLIKRHISGSVLILTRTKSAAYCHPYVTNIAQCTWLYLDYLQCRYVREVAAL